VLGHVLWGARVTADAHVGKGTREPVNRGALHHGRLDIETDPGIKVYRIKGPRARVMSYDLVTYHSSRYPFRKPLVLEEQKAGIIILTIHGIPRAAAYTVGRQLLFKSSLPPKTIQIVSIGRVAEALML
jgi:hypothetical protein